MNLDCDTSEELYPAQDTLLHVKSKHGRKWTDRRQETLSYFKRLYNVFDGDNVRSFKIICPKCRRVNILKACSC